MIQNLIFRIIFFESIIAGMQHFYIQPHVPVNTIIFRLSSRESQSQQKLAKKITHFTIHFRSNNLTHFTNLNSFDIENNKRLQHSQKTFLTLQIFQQTYFCLVLEKIFGLHHFLTPKNCIPVALWK